MRHIVTTGAEAWGAKNLNATQSTGISKKKTCMAAYIRGGDVVAVEKVNYIRHSAGESAETRNAVNGTALCPKNN
jgi:hypothetical protein